MFRHLFECIYLCCECRWITPKKVFHHILELIPLFLNVYSFGVLIYAYNCVALFISMYFSLLWFYTDHQRRCYTIYFSVYYYSMIICRASKESVVLFILMYIIILWLYLEHQRRCWTIYLDVYSSSVILYRASNKVFYYLFKCASQSIGVHFPLPYDSMKNTKEDVPLTFVMYFLLTW